MVDIIKTHIKPIMAGAILIALLAIILALLATDGTVATAFHGKAAGKAAQVFETEIGKAARHRP